MRSTPASGDAGAIMNKEALDYLQLVSKLFFMYCLEYSIGNGGLLLKQIYNNLYLFYN